MRAVPTIARVLAVALLGALVACASSSGTGSPDAGIDGSLCVPDPDGETCNGEDDDCDGSADEGYPGVGEVCSVGVGGCAASGTTVCTADGEATECSVEPATAGTELCGTTIDEDCDGMTDEGFPDLGEPCSAGTGACFVTGEKVCASSGLATTCGAVPGDMTDEVCDGVDNDCNGQTDEPFQINQACDGPGDTDKCLEGVWACDGAGGRVCSDNTSSTLDLCGGGDQDCDPLTADGSQDDTIGDTCDGTGDTDSCAEGIRGCSGGGYTCSDSTGSTTELCAGDAVDENCDGFVDEGYTLNDNTACWTVNMGSVSGDTGADVLSSGANSEEWFIVYISEDDSGLSGVYLSATVDLYSPPGVDYDLYAYCFNCGTTAVASSSAGGLTGHHDYVYLRGDDDQPLGGEDDGHWVLLEVRYWASNRCANYSITVTGNTAVSTNTCNI